MPSYPIGDDDATPRFPALFSHIWVFDSVEEFVAGLIRLSSCHPHNFGVQKDRSSPAIWGSEMVMDCLREDRHERYERRQDGEDPYQRVEMIFYNLLRKWFEEHTATRRRDMPNNIAVDLRRALQRQGLMLCRIKAPSTDG